MLSIHLRLGLPSGLFPSGFLTSNQYTFLFSLFRATCPTRLIALYLIILIILEEEYKSRSSSLCSFLHRPVISSLFGPNILLSNFTSHEATKTTFPKNTRKQIQTFNCHSHCLTKTNKQTPWPLVRERTIPTDRPPLVDEI
jgi:hypothetical protein